MISNISVLTFTVISAKSEADISAWPIYRLYGHSYQWGYDFLVKIQATNQTWKNLKCLVCNDLFKFNIHSQQAASCSPLGGVCRLAHHWDLSMPR